jgi:hypothetical protein
MSYVHHPKRSPTIPTAAIVATSDSAMASVPPPKTKAMSNAGMSEITKHANMERPYYHEPIVASCCVELVSTSYPLQSA